MRSLKHSGSKLHAFPLNMPPEPGLDLFSPNDEPDLGKMLGQFFWGNPASLFCDFNMSGYSIDRVTKCYLNLFEEMIRARGE